MKKAPAVGALLLAALAMIFSHWSAAVASANTVVIPPFSTEMLAAGPVSLLPDEFADTARFNDSRTARGSFTRIDDLEGEPRWRAVNPTGSTNQNGINAEWALAAPVRRGEVVYARFLARAIDAQQESGEAEGFLFVQPTAPNSEREFAQAFSVGPDWTVVHASFVASRDYAPGEARFYLAFANLPQTVEFAALRIVSFGNRLTIAQLPETRFSYAGREADAPWRSAALRRIEEIRTSPITVIVRDARGRPVRAAEVDVAMTRSAFLWGSSVSAERITDTDNDAERYRREIVRLFDVAVIENGFKWQRWVEPPYRERAMRSLDWLEQQGLLVKGHNLSWTAWRFTPDYIAHDPALRARIAELNDAHIRDLTAATRGRLIGWDVVNEPVNATDYYAVMPREHIAQWFKLARESDPALKLTLNEYGMLNRSSSPLMIERVQEFARMLTANGAEIDILGVQGHVGQTPRPPASILSDLDLLARDGHQIQITEFDMNTRDEALQRDYTRDFLIALYSHRAVTGFIMWGFWESEHWKPAAAMFRPDWSAKPNLAVWEDLVLKQWRTNLSLRTGRDGSASGRGHHGLYRVTVVVDGQTVIREFTLAPGDPAQWAITLP